MTSITHLTCEYRVNPLGIGLTAPRLSWQMQSDRPGARQSAYRILAAGEPGRLREGEADLWDSGRKETDQSLHIPYVGKKLGSRQRVYWKVTVWDESGAATDSAPAWFELGLLKRADWKGKWIGAALAGGPRNTIPAPFLRKSFQLPAEGAAGGGVKRARLYVTALGLYECSINGRPVGDDVFNPGWTDYRRRVQYKVYDVASLLREGENVLGAILGDGWAVGHVGWNHRQQYFDRPRLLAQLEITLADKHIILRPQPGGGLTHAAGRLKTPYGELVSEWRIEAGKFDWRVVAPPNTTATAYLPAQAGSKVMLNGQAASGLVHEVGAGEYRFIVS